MALRLPSLDALYADARASARRFPAVLVASAAAGAVALALSSIDGGTREYELLATLLLGIPLTFACAAWVERRRPSPAVRIVATIGVVAVLALCFASGTLQTPQTFTFRFVQLVIAAHMLVAFLPYAEAGRDAGFWQYNASLFTRFATAVFFSVVLYVGLGIALTTAHVLLDLPTPPQTYVRLWLVVVFGFNTWFLLAGVPDPLPDAPPSDGYPRGLRVLTQYLLIPLVTLYLAILYAYAVKIVLERTWPEGTIGYLVSAFSILGILNLLLVHPIQDAPGHRWIRTYARSFYLALLPLLVLLVLGTWRRVAEYGITERRYLLLALGAWIGAMATYFTLSRRRDIRVIPISLCVGALVTLAGPWGAYEVSRRSQIERLTRMLETHGILHGDRVGPATGPVDFGTRKQISSILDYLNDVHGGAGIEQWFAPGTLAPDASSGMWRFTSWARGRSPSMMEVMGVAYLRAGETPESERRATLQSELRPYFSPGTSPIPIAGFDVLASVQLHRGPGVPMQSSFPWEGRSLSVMLHDDGRTVEIGDGRSTVPLPVVDLYDQLVASRASAGIPKDEMTLSVEAPSFRGRVYFHDISGTRTDAGTIIDHLNATILVVAAGGPSAPP